MAQASLLGFRRPVTLLLAGFNAAHHRCFPGNVFGAFQLIDTDSRLLLHISFFHNGPCISLTPCP